ncbi:MAG: hypothetical protein IJ011_03330 [Clostridia bacterium]|nr:hypothetical protein [Clostridia bacterium]
MKLYVSPEATLESVAISDIITVSLGSGVGTVGSVDLSKYFTSTADDGMDMGDGL